ncbi:MAG: DNA-binding MarR family transcriptional regulator [Candidatus Azotimanducaceae bacterium]|jgi:DNA-binding MarR family transcriptional regulator
MTKNATTIQIDQISPEHCVSSNLHKAARAITKVYEDAIRPSGIRRSQFTILALLYRLDSVRLSVLSDRLVIDRTTLSRNLKPLQSLGLIIVKPSADDARAKDICLSKNGKLKYKEALKLWSKAQKLVIKKYGSGNWRDLEVALSDLRGRVSN